MVCISPGTKRGRVFYVCSNLFFGLLVFFGEEAGERRVCVEGCKVILLFWVFLSLTTGKRNNKSQSESHWCTKKEIHTLNHLKPHYVTKNKKLATHRTNNSVEHH